MQQKISNEFKKLVLLELKIYKKNSNIVGRRIPEKMKQIKFKKIERNVSIELDKKSKTIFSIGRTKV